MQGKPIINGRAAAEKLLASCASCCSVLLRLDDIAACVGVGGLSVGVRRLSIGVRALRIGVLRWLAVGIRGVGLLLLLLLVRVGRLLRRVSCSTLRVCRLTVRLLPVRLLSVRLRREGLAGRDVRLHVLRRRGYDDKLLLAVAGGDKAAPHPPCEEDGEGDVGACFDVPPPAVCNHGGDVDEVDDDNGDNVNYCAGTQLIVDAHEIGVAIGKEIAVIGTVS